MEAHQDRPGAVAHASWRIAAKIIGNITNKVVYCQESNPVNENLHRKATAMSVSAGEQGSLRRLLTTALVLTVTMALVNAFVFTLGVLAPALREHVGLSRAGLGMVIAVYYAIAALTSATLARGVDGVSFRGSIFGLYVTIFVACMLTSVALSPALIVVAAAIAGVGSGLSNPVTNAIIASTKQNRGFLVGLKQSGVQFTAVIVGVIIPALEWHLGWRRALMALAFMFLAVGTMTLLWPTPARQFTERRKDRKAAFGPQLRTLRTYAFFMGAGLSTINTYLVLYGTEAVGMTLAQAGGLIAAFGASGGIGRFAFAVVAERFGRLEVWLLLAGAVSVTGLLMTTITHSLPFVWLGVVTIGLSGAAWHGIIMLAVIRSVPRELTGHATGFVWVGFFLGLAGAPAAFGLIVDLSGRYGAGWLLTGASFAAATVLMVLALRSRPLTNA